MKKIIPILVIGFLILSGLGAVATNDNQTIHTILESVTYSEPTIKDNGKYMTIDLAEATSCLMGEDKPDLPVVTRVYTFPSGTKIENVKVTFSEPYNKVISKDMAHQETLTLLAKVGLDDFRDKYPSQLSGGMQRRAELARALINQPKIMLMDEPFRGLDAMTRKLMQEYYLKLYKAKTDKLSKT